MVVIEAHRDTSASASDVWSVLANGWLYPSWVVGASRMRAVSDDWPAVGSRLHHSVGAWPALIDDSTEVLVAEENRELRLLAQVTPTKAIVRLRMEPRGSGCHLQMSEVAASAPLSWVPRIAQDLAVLPRNLECLRRLSFLAERNTKA
ncbi:SRPBCC family protein [Rhodococcus sp. NPDC057529]|uniref:SRPBCC family protein n=1 Tax=Rhodococcus sp. NPDC057529 TaxID=3346158 RepID=UPI00366DEA36